MIKFASAALLGAWRGEHAVADRTLKTGHRATFAYEARPGYLYVRSRMISSRVNDNWDYFGPDEIKKGFQSFLGKPVFVNHDNHDHRKARGVVIDAVLHEDRAPDGGPDTWVEGLMEIDARSYPKLAQAILAGHVDRTSMGVDVEESICSHCGNKATTPLEYCRHVPGQKGLKVWKVTASGAKQPHLIYEECRGLSFFENSLLVEEPADPTAYFLGEVDLGPGLEHLTPRRQRRTAARRTADSDSAVVSQPGDVPVPAALENLLHGVTLGRDEQGFFAYTPDGGRTPSVVSPYDLSASDLRTLRGHNATRRTGGVELTAAGPCPDCAGLNTTASRSGEADCWDCGSAYHLRAQAAGPRHLDPADHPFFQKHPVHHDNIVDHWNQASDDEKADGKNWYKDAQTIAHGVGAVTGHSPTTAAGVFAAYSPQKGWDSNKHQAARVLREGKGIGGPGSGVFAKEENARNADRMLAGEHYNNVFSDKAHKIRDFAHLIEHGGDADPDQPRVVIDRHALGVASGKRISTPEYNKFPNSSRHYYDHVVGAYHEAAKHISGQEGEPVHAHQVQAVTWLVRQRLNQAAERAGDTKSKGFDKGREVGRQRAQQGWEDYRNQHFPDLERGPGTGYAASRRRRMAYGETKAPPDVDTLRHEECPVCGEPTSSTSGKCPVCGFQPPPSFLADPDLDKAKELDELRDHNDDDDDRDQFGDPDSDDDRLDDDLDDDLDEDDEDENENENENDGEQLRCSACGAEFDPGEAEEGQRCPECGEAALAPANNTDTDPEDDPDEDDEDDGADGDDDQEPSEQPRSAANTAPPRPR